MNKYIFGVDIGGTTCKIGWFSDNGKLLDKWEIGTNTYNQGCHILDDVAQSITNKMNQSNIDKDAILGLGIGVPSPVIEKGIARNAINLGWRDYDVRSFMQEKMEMPVRVGNDVNVAFLGEQWKGSAAGYADGVMITLGTGVGGAVIMDNRVITGYGGAAGELGHIIVNEKEEECCGCGRKGCLEQYTSATGLVRMARKRLLQTNGESMLEQIQPLTAKSIFDLAQTGDAIAKELVETFCEILGNTLADISSVLNPGIIVIGGGVSKAGPFLIETVEKYFRKRALYTSEDTRFVQASLGNDAGIYGAARMILDNNV